MSRVTFEEDVRINGNLAVAGSLTPQARTFLTQDDNAVFPVLWTLWRVWDAIQTNLPNPGASDDLGLYGGTFGTDTPTIQTGDVKTLTATRYARAFIPVPAEYVAGQTFTLRFMAGMKTTLPSGAATLDVEAFRRNREGLVSGADLYTGAALDIKSLTLANKDFPLTVSALQPGDELDVRIAISTVDAATGTPVIGILGAIERLVDIKG